MNRILTVLSLTFFLPFVSPFLVFDNGLAEQTAIVITTKNVLREKSFILEWKQCTAPETTQGGRIYTMESGVGIAL